MSEYCTYYASSIHQKSLVNTPESLTVSRQAVDKIWMVEYSDKFKKLPQFHLNSLTTAKNSHMTFGFPEYFTLN